MDNIVPALYGSYGKYVNTLRMLPLDLDGLIPAQRRVLIVINKLARNRFVKCKKIVGETTGTYHPHGDCYSTVVQMYYQGFIEKQGNFGDTVGLFPSSPAAPRYTECKSSKFLNEILEYIDCADWDFIETDEKEPIFIPTVFPMFLINKYFYSGIGFGCRCLAPCYLPKDLYNRLMYLLEKGKKVIIKPFSDCDILSPDKDLEELLTTGKATITFRGKVEKIKDECKLIVHSVPYGKKINTMIQSEKRDKTKDVSRFFTCGDVGFIDQSKNGKTMITFDIRRTRDKYKIFEEFSKLIEDFLTASVSFDTIVVDRDGNAFRKPIDNLLLDTYKLYTKITKTKFIKDKKQVQEEIDDLEALKTIRPHIKNYLECEDIKSSIENISKKTKISVETISRLFSKYRIQKLFTVKTDTSDLVSEVDKIDKNIENLEKIVIDKYNSIIKLI